ncbi:hypothetical protein BGZ88_001801 [Linnemannia elongata]|nr:hypothetical protein BGZ88_001801 [Linnemannia elongata]
MACYRKATGAENVESMKAVDKTCYASIAQEAPETLGNIKECLAKCPNWDRSDEPQTLEPKEPTESENAKKPTSTEPE